MQFPVLMDIKGWAAFIQRADLRVFPHEDVVQTYRLLHAARRTRECEFFATYLRRLTFALACKVHQNREIAGDVCQEIFIALHDPKDRAYSQIADDFAGVVKRRVWAVYARTKRWDTRNKTGPDEFDPPDENQLNDADKRAIIEIVHATASPSAIVRVAKTTAEVARDEGVSERHAFRLRKSAEDELRAIAQAAQNQMSRSWLDITTGWSPSAHSDNAADIDDDYLTIIEYVLLVFGYDSPTPSQSDINRWSTALPMYAADIAAHAELLNGPFSADGLFSPSREDEKMLTVMWRTALRNAA